MLWQREFFDHVLRSNECYSKNGITFGPIRCVAEEWKYAGEIETLML